MFCCRISVAAIPDGFIPEFEDVPYHHHEQHYYSPPVNHAKQHDPHYGGHDHGPLSHGAHEEVYVLNDDPYHSQSHHS